MNEWVWTTAGVKLTEETQVLVVKPARATRRLRPFPRGMS